MDPLFYYQDLFNEGGANVDLVNAAQVSTGTLNVASGANFAYLPPYAVLESDASENIIGVNLTNNQVLVGVTGGAPTKVNLDTASTPSTIAGRDVSGASHFAEVYTNTIAPDSSLSTLMKGDFLPFTSSTYGLGSSFAKWSTLYSDTINTTTSVKLSTLIANASTISIQAGLLPDVDITRDLGSALLRWNNLYINTINTNALSLTTLNCDNLAGKTGVNISVSSSLNPSADITYSLGNSALFRWLNAYVYNVYSTNLNTSTGFIDTISPNSGTSISITGTTLSITPAISCGAISSTTVSATVITATDINCHNITPSSTNTYNIGTSSAKFASGDIQNLFTEQISSRLGTLLLLPSNSLVEANATIWSNYAYNGGGVNTAFSQSCILGSSATLFLGAFSDVNLRGTIQAYNQGSAAIPLILQPTGSRVVVGSYDTGAQGATDLVYVNGNETINGALTVNTTSLFTGIMTVSNINTSGTHSLTIGDSTATNTILGATTINTTGSATTSIGVAGTQTTIQGAAIKYLNNVASSTPTEMNVFEELIVSTLVSGPWIVGNNPTVGLSLVRTNNKVMMSFNTFSQTAANPAAMASVSAIPARFRPTTSTFCDMVLVNSGTTRQYGYMEVQTTGIINWYAGPVTTVFAGSGTAQVFGHCISWDIR